MTLTLVSLLAITTLPLDARANATRAASHASAAISQTQQRQRRVAAPTTQQTPQAKPTPQPKPTPQTRATNTTGAPAASPVNTTPSASAAASVAASSPALEELRIAIRNVLDEPQLASAIAGVKIVSLDSGRTLFEENSGKLLNPASNMKLFTIAAALARLSPDFRITTSVYAPARPDDSGTIRGDLRIYGRGDPTYARRFTTTDARAAIDDLAARIQTAGVRKIEGDLIADESYFAGSPLGRGWEWDDLQWYYGAEVSALTVGDNAIEFAVKPGTKIGELCLVTTDASAAPLVSVAWSDQQGGYWMFPYPTLATTVTTPVTATSTAPPKANGAEIMNRTSQQAVALAAATSPAPITILNRATTTPRGTKRELRVFRPLDSDIIEVSGTLPQGDNGFSGSVAVARPAMIFATMLRQSLAARGIVFTGETRVMNRDDADFAAAAPLASLVEIASKQSPALSVIARETMKPSQNLYTELLLRQLAAPPANGEPAQGVTADAGLAALNAFLRAAGIADTAVVTADGSGLSRGDFVTADAVVRLLTYMDKHPYRQAFRDSLPVAGVDGTLRNRLKNTRAAGNILAKTGTLSHATSLSGYVTSRAGERLVFSLVINNHAPDIDPRALFTEPIAVLLADFNARSQVAP